MKPSIPAVKLTYQDYLQFPEDGRRHELMDGEHYVTPAPTTKHQTVVMNLALLLGNFIREHRLGRIFGAPVDVVLSEFDVVQPDLVFLSNDRLDRITEANVQGAPDLVVEILSQSTRARDEVLKRRIYEKYGVQEYWMVDPGTEAVGTVTVLRLRDGRFPPGEERILRARDRLSTSLLPGLEIPVVAVFE